MADIVNLQQDEYDPAIEKLDSLHEMIIATLEKISKEIRELSEIDGGFYIDMISAKIRLLLDTLDSGIINPMMANMEATRISMSDFAEIITNVDSACDV